MCLLDYNFEYDLKEEMFEFFKKLNNVEVLADFVDYEEEESKKYEIIEYIEDLENKIEKGEVKPDNLPYSYYCEELSGDMFVNHYTQKYEVDDDDIEEVLKRNPWMDEEDNAEAMINQVYVLQQDKVYMAEKKMKDKSFYDLEDNESEMESIANELWFDSFMNENHNDIDQDENGKNESGGDDDKESKADEQFEEKKEANQEEDEEEDEKEV